MLQSVLRRTWAPMGQTPILDNWAAHDRLSVMSALTIAPKRLRFGLYFAVFRDNITHDCVEMFLKLLRRSVGRGLVVILDKLNAHRTAANVLRGKDGEDGPYTFEWLPSYAPELNPVEFIWGHAKCGGLANASPDDLGDLDARLDCALRQTTRDLALAAFDHAGLDLHPVTG